MKCQSSERIACCPIFDVSCHRMTYPLRVCPYLVFSACLKFEFHLGIWFPSERETLQCPAMACRKLPVPYRRPSWIFSWIEGLTMHFHGSGILIHPCFHPALLIVYGSFKDRYVLPFQYCLIPVFLQSPLGVFVLCKYPKCLCQDDVR